MKRPAYPFVAVVGQDDMKLALLLAAVDWRLGVLLRGDKGSGKTTTARGLASLLPHPAPFINLPIGTTEDRLLGGLHIERALQGDPVLKPGLLSEAHGGVLYIDEVNLLPAHLGDALLDTAASGINVVEREGMSASHPAEFVLLGSMNPEEGKLRPQLLDRFALSVTISSPADRAERRTVMERRMAFERAPDQFIAGWSAEEAAIQARIVEARARLTNVQCPSAMLDLISKLVCESGVLSMRADLAVMRAAIAYAALEGDETVNPHHIEGVLPFVLAHRTRDAQRPSPPSPPPPTQQKPETKDETPAQDETKREAERIFPPRPVDTPSLQLADAAASGNGSGFAVKTHLGPIIGSRPSDSPREFDIRATLTHALRETGSIQLQTTDLHERMREPHAGTRFLFVIDSSGSHAVRERMRLVKGAVVSFLNNSFKRGDEVAIIIFRGTSAEVVLEPTSVLADAFSTLEYLPTGGRTPLAHALMLSKGYITAKTILVLMTDGHANYPASSGDPWQEALDAAPDLNCATLVVDTETTSHPLGRTEVLAVAMKARYLMLNEVATMGDLTVDFSTK